MPSPLLMFPAAVPKLLVPAKTNLKLLAFAQADMALLTAFESVRPAGREAASTRYGIGSPRSGNAYRVGTPLASASKPFVLEPPLSPLGAVMEPSGAGFPAWSVTSAPGVRPQSVLVRSRFNRFSCPGANAPFFSRCNLAAPASPWAANNVPSQIGRA